MTPLGPTVPGREAAAGPGGLLAPAAPELVRRRGRDPGTAAHVQELRVLADTAVPQIHAAGGLVSYNHPYGYGARRRSRRAAGRDARQGRDGCCCRTTRAALGCRHDRGRLQHCARGRPGPAHRAVGRDVPQRDLPHRQRHQRRPFGKNWDGVTTTGTRRPGPRERGERTCSRHWRPGEPGAVRCHGYRGSLDMLVDGSCPMGSVSVSGVTSRKLVASATAIPAGGALQVLPGTVDYAGTAALAANTKVIGTYTAADLAGGRRRRNADRGHEQRELRRAAGHRRQRHHGRRFQPRLDAAEHATERDPGRAASIGTCVIARRLPR